MRQIVMVGFLQAQHGANLVSSWRHPASRTDSYSPAYYRLDLPYPQRGDWKW